MAPSQTVTEALVIELAEKSFNTFCDDISGMFGIDIRCSPKQVTPQTVNGLKEHSQDLAVFYAVNVEGVLNGNFHLVFDRQGLFILAGIIAMQPEQMILEDAKDGSLEKAQKQTGILQEVGAALVGSWERIFRKELDGHDRFTQADTFIGNPWDNPQESIGLAPDEQVSFVPYDMTVGFFPPFKCGIIFKKEFLAGTTQPNTEQPVPEEEKAREEGESKTQAETENIDPNASEGMQESEEAAREETEEKIQQETENRDPNTSEGMQETEEAAQDETVPTEETAATQEPEADAEQKPDDLEQQPATTDEADNKQDRPISDAIKQMTQSFAASLDESTPSIIEEKPPISNKDTLLAVCAKDIMQKDVIWGNPDDSVQQALAKIQQNDAGYMMIGPGQVLEGIVSKSDLTGALSPYLKTTFAKWRRPLDDATLQIRVKWIMGKPTNTIQPETPLTAIMEKMCQTRLRCLPVVDEQSKVLGLVTVFDIFDVFLNESSNK